MPTITIDVASDTLTCIAALAAQHNRTVSEVIEQALSDYIVRKAARGDAPEKRTSYTQYHRAYRERHREQYNAYMRAWGKRNRARLTKKEREKRMEKRATQPKP